MIDVMFEAAVSGSVLRTETLQAVLLEPEVVFVILARNEAGVLEDTLLDLNTYLQENETIHVVADHCEDQTAEIARQAGAHVWERTGNGASGKGAALGWWMQQTCEQDPDQIVVVLDADSRLAPDFSAGLQRSLQTDVQVLQARILPSLEKNFPGALVSALSELSEQFADDAMRRWAGWPVRLRGTGMVFRRSILARFAPQLCTVVEDVELSILLAANGVHIQSAPHLILLDPKPTSGTGVVNQRARWLQGQVQIWKRYGPQIFTILRQGLSGWSLLSSLLLKPKTLVLLTAALGSALLLIAETLSGASLGGAFLGGFTLIYAMIESAKIFFMLSRIPDRRHIWKAILYAPVFLFVWPVSLFLAVVSGSTWLRSRPSMDPTRMG